MAKGFGRHRKQLLLTMTCLCTISAGGFIPLLMSPRFPRPVRQLPSMSSYKAASGIDPARPASSDSIIGDISEMRPLVVVIAGPTASEKSAVAAALCSSDRAAALLGLPSGSARGHIISADSVQVYKDVRVGANKPTEEERQKTAHHLVDVVELTGTYNAADWMRDATYVVDVLSGKIRFEEDINMDTSSGDSLEIIKGNIKRVLDEASSLESQHVVPVVVGGSMMYLEFLVHGLPDAAKPTPEAKKRAREAIERFRAQDEEQEDGIAWQAAKDHAASFGDAIKQRVEKLPGKDWYRLQRMLEVGYTAESKGDQASKDVRVHDIFTGRRFGGLGSRGYDVRCFCLCPDDRMKHKEYVDSRCEDMLIRGLLKETTDLAVSGKLPDNGLTAKAIGYRQTLNYLRRKDARVGDHQAFDDYIDSFAAATGEYAKRQMAYFRKDGQFAFVPVPLSKNPQDRVASVADWITELCQLSREEFENELSVPEGGASSNGMSVSARTIIENLRQGKNMKFFQRKRHKLVVGSEERMRVMEEADECTRRMQMSRSFSWRRLLPNILRWLKRFRGRR